MTIGPNQALNLMRSQQMTIGPNQALNLLRARRLKDCSFEPCYMIGPNQALNLLTHDSFL